MPSLSTPEAVLRDEAPLSLTELDDERLVEQELAARQRRGEAFRFEHKAERDRIGVARVCSGELSMQIRTESLADG
jgi:hypothetical protein